MSIAKLPSGKYQAKMQGGDGNWISGTFNTKKEAEAYDFQLKNQKRNGTVTTNSAKLITLDEFFDQWYETVHSRASKGWRKEQHRNFKKFISPVLGDKKLETISPQLVARVLNRMADLGKSETTQLHVFILMRKVFTDAIELFRLLTYNPVQRSLKPRISVRETAHLNLSQIRELLTHVQDKPYCIAIWLQLYLGFRVGELQALQWTDVDLENGIAHIRRAYVRKERTFKDFPKGRRHHSHRIPKEVLEILRQEKLRATSPFIATSPSGEMLSYEHYSRSLRRYCKELGVTSVATHGLRHSTSELYLSHGATRDDIRQLFAHSSMSVTDRYIHQKGSNLEKVANVIQLFSGSSMDLPRRGLEKADEKGKVVLSN